MSPASTSPSIRRSRKSRSPDRPLPGAESSQASSGNLKRVQLELGGKGANIVFDDADLDAALNGSAFAIFHNQGQACIAGSRLLLHEKIADKFLDRFLKLAASIKLGNPLDPQTEMGPLTSLAHRDRVLSYCKVAREEGGEILLGGKAPADAGTDEGMLRDADRGPRAAEGSRLPGRSLRPLRHGHYVQGRRRSDRHRQRHGLRPRRRPMDHAIFRARIAWPGKSSPGWSG